VKEGVKVNFYKHYAYMYNKYSVLIKYYTIG